MTAKNAKRENAKTRYNAKKPTVSFRISLEEYERLDGLRKDGTTYRTIVLKGAEMIEKDKVNKKRLKDEENRRIQEAVAAARMDALRGVVMGRCCYCKKPLKWDLTNPGNRAILEKAINEREIHHPKCQW
jgi:predicted DNA-binding protein